MYITISNKFNTEVTLCSIGASICDIKTMDYNNELASICITPKNRKDFNYADSYFGKTIGRTGGRVSNSEFELNGKKYHINSNDPNGLHGGIDSLAMKNFMPSQIETDDYHEVTFEYLSKDLESGYPGNLKLKVIYRLYKEINQLTLTYDAISDKDTLLNLSNHAYFNLNAESGKNALEHVLFIHSNKMERIDNLLPREIVECKNIYSFEAPHMIKDYIFDNEIIENTNGYDYPYLFNTPGIQFDNIILADYSTGRKLTVSTTYPCVVVYTCNYCEDVVVNSNRKLAPYDAVCLECMYLPNSINSDFIEDKKDILRANTKYNETIIYKFGLLE